MKSSFSFLSKLYTAVLVMLPAVNVYRSIIPSIELGTLIILFCTGIFLLSPKREKVGVDKIWFFVLAIFLVCTILSSMTFVDYNSRYLFRFLKIVVIVVSIAVCGKDHFDYKYGVNVLKYFSITCSVFITIQTILYSFGIVLPGIITSLVSLQEGEIVASTAFSLYRPTAFFFEPAHYACYQFVFLSYLLTIENIDNRYKLILLTLLGIFLSTSGTGYIIVPILIIASAILGKKDMKVIIYTILILSALAYIIMNTTIGQSAIARFIDEEGQLGGAATGRLDSGASFLFHSLPENLQWIGCGFGYRPNDVYFPSLYAILYGDGYVGLGALIILAIIYFYHTSNFGKLLLIAYSLMFTGAGVFNFGVIGLYFIFISIDIAMKKIPQLPNHQLI